MLCLVCCGVLLCDVNLGYNEMLKENNVSCVVHMMSLNFVIPFCLWCHDGKDVWLFDLYE